MSKSGEKSQNCHFDQDKKLCNFLLRKYISELGTAGRLREACLSRNKKSFGKISSKSIFRTRSVKANPAKLTRPYRQIRAHPNHGRESWVPSECTAGLGLPQGVHMENGSVQTARTASEFFRKVIIGTWLANVYSGAEIYPVP